MAGFHLDPVRISPLGSFGSLREPGRPNTAGPIDQTALDSRDGLVGLFRLILGQFRAVL